MGYRTGRRRRSRFELLERRNLLAVHLAVNLHNLPQTVSPGDEVSYTMQVHNAGPDAAIGALVQGEVPLTSVNWIRTGGFSSSVDADRLDGTEGFAFQAYGGRKDGRSSGDVKIVGDINGDGVDDLFVGAPESYVLFGGQSTGETGHVDGASVTSEQGFVIPGTDGTVTTGFSTLGPSAAKVGDINDDGIEDLAFVTPYAGRNESRTSQVHIFFGRVDWGDTGVLDLAEASQHLVFRGPALGGLPVVQGVGDINGDGLSDLAIHGDDDVAAVFFGDSEFGEGIDFSLETVSFGTGFVVRGVRTVNAAGDFNGDGIADIVFSSPGAAPRRGASRIVFGNADIGANAELDISALDGSNGLVVDGYVYGLDGSGTLGVGDVNGDGYDDVMISGRFPLASAQTELVLVLGQPEPIEGGLMNVSDSNNHSIVTIQVGDPQRAAQVVLFAPAGDLNADGLSDVIIGAPEQRHGATFVMLGAIELGEERDVDLNARLDGENGFEVIRLDGEFVGENFSEFGRSVDGNGDFNGDGVADVVFGARYGGESYVLYGKPSVSGTGAIDELVDLESSASFSYEISGTVGEIAEAESLNFTTSVASCENHGLLPDDAVLMEISHSENLVQGEHTEFVIRLTNPDKRRAVEVTLESPLSRWLIDPTWERSGGYAPILDLLKSDQTGIVLQGLAPRLIGDRMDQAGDLDGDGFDDFFYFSDRTGGGDHRMFLWRGSNDTSTTTRFSADDGRFWAASDFGFDPKNTQFAIVGDVNVDGFDDILIAGRGADEVRAHLIFGHPEIDYSEQVEIPAIDGTNGAMIEFERPLEVSSLGDFDGDGIDDMLFGADSTFWRDPASAFIVFGDPKVGASGVIRLADLDGVNGITLIKGDDGSAGDAVSGAGDVNGDGTDDVLLGGWHDRIIGGEVTVIHGKATSGVGSGDIVAERFVLPPNGALEYAISGVAVVDDVGLAVNATATTCVGQQDSDVSNNSAAQAVQHLSVADIDSDGQVSLQDLLILTVNYGTTDTASRETGDLNGDRAVDFADFLILSEAYRNTRNEG